MQTNVTINLIVGKPVPPNHGVMPLTADLDTIEWVCLTNDIVVSIAKDSTSVVSGSPPTPFDEEHKLGKSKKGVKLPGGTSSKTAIGQVYKWTAVALDEFEKPLQDGGKWDPHIIIR
jgi:hypothetical protein